MIGLFRADLLRLRHRGDLWIGVGAVLVLASLLYVSAANSANTGFYWPPENGPLPPEMLEQAARDRDPFTFPFSIIMMLQTGGAILAAVMVFVAAAWLGTEFSWGTIRQLTLLRPDRWRFVLVRLAACLALAVVLLVLLMALGALMPVIVPLEGSGHAPVVTPVALLALAASQSLTIVAAIALGLMFTVLTRSGSLGIVFSAVYFVADAALGGNPVWEKSELLLWVPRLLLGTRLRALSEDVQATFGPADPHGYVAAPTLLTIPPLAGLLIVLAWILALVLVSCLLIRRADVRE